MLKFLNKKKLKETYDDFNYAEKMDCYGLWQQYDKLCEKTAKIVLSDVIQNYAKDKNDVEFAREILTLQNELFKIYFEMINENKAP